MELVPFVTPVVYVCLPPRSDAISTSIGGMIRTLTQTVSPQIMPNSPENKGPRPRWVEEEEEDHHPRCGPNPWVPVERPRPELDHLQSSFISLLVFFFFFPFPQRPFSLLSLSSWLSLSLFFFPSLSFSFPLSLSLSLSFPPLHFGGASLMFGFDVGVEPWTTVTISERDERSRGE